METRWGSCLVKKKIITLNKRLLEVPRNCIEYVVMHELCHLIYPNHSKQFYSFLTMLMPDWKERKDYLDKSAAYWLQEENLQHHFEINAKPCAKSNHSLHCS